MLLLYPREQSVSRKVPPPPRKISVSNPSNDSFKFKVCCESIRKEKL